jgi:hypothetical protein
MTKTALGAILLSVLIAVPALADSDDHRGDPDKVSVRLGGVGHQKGDRDRRQSTAPGGGGPVADVKDPDSKIENRGSAGPVAGAAGPESQSEHHGVLGALAGVAGDLFADAKDPGSGRGTSNVHGAPGPIAGAGLPILAIGGGIYWIVRRVRRKKTDLVS